MMTKMMATSALHISTVSSAIVTVIYIAVAGMATVKQTVTGSPNDRGTVLGGVPMSSPTQQ